MGVAMLRNASSTAETTSKSYWQLAWRIYKRPTVHVASVQCVWQRTLLEMCIVHVLQQELSLNKAVAFQLLCSSCVRDVRVSSTF